MEGRPTDYTTLAKFRTEFKAELKGLFPQVGRVALSIGLVRLGEVGFDGTRVKANHTRYATRTAATLEQKLAGRRRRSTCSNWPAYSASCTRAEN